MWYHVVIVRVFPHEEERLLYTGALNVIRCWYSCSSCDTNYVVLTLNVSEAIRQDCSSSDDTAYVVLTLGVSEKRSIRLMVERTCSVVRQNKPSWLVSH